jgi:hypothetical protein
MQKRGPYGFSCRLANLPHHLWKPPDLVSTNGRKRGPYEIALLASIISKRTLSSQTWPLP